MQKKSVSIRVSKTETQLHEVYFSFGKDINRKLTVVFKDVVNVESANCHELSFLAKRDIVFNPDSGFIIHAAFKCTAYLNKKSSEELKNDDEACAFAEQIKKEIIKDNNVYARISSILSSITAGAGFTPIITPPYFCENED